jgi:very-short-patch-repair endonuclease
MLRANSSPIERRLWRLLYTFRTGGYHFRKQSPIGPYTVDMACHHAKLVIEVDGDTHGSDSAKRNDARRDAFLHGEGYTVLRITNDDVVHNPDGVYQLIALALEGKPKQPRVGRPLPSPPHKGEGVPSSLRLDLSQLPTGTTAIHYLSHPPADTSPLVGEAGRGDSDV